MMWSRYFGKKGHAGVRELISDGSAVVHEYTITELLIGKASQEKLTHAFSKLVHIEAPSSGAMHHFISLHKPEKVGLVDVALVLACRTYNLDLLTEDSGLAEFFEKTAPRRLRHH
jgi:predicted nucleic acid-binding protein